MNHARVLSMCVMILKKSGRDKPDPVPLFPFQHGMNWNRT